MKSVHVSLVFVLVNCLVLSYEISSCIPGVCFSKLFGSLLWNLFMYPWCLLRCKFTLFWAVSAFLVVFVLVNCLVLSYEVCSRIIHVCFLFSPLLLFSLPNLRLKITVVSKALLALHMCAFNRGNTEGANSSENFVWCLCICFILCLCRGRFCGCLTWEGEEFWNVHFAYDGVWLSWGDPTHLTGG